MRRRKDIHGRSDKGFTLVELVAVLAIMAIIAAISIPSLIPWYENYKATERQANAELIYTSAQANMVSLKAQGHLSPNDDSSNEDFSSNDFLSVAISNIDTENAAYPGWTGNQIPDDPDLVCLTDATAANGACETALDLLLPNIEQHLSRVGFLDIVSGDTGCYYIEINPSTGYVYGVFYSEKQFGVGDVSQAGTYEWASADRGNSSTLAAQDIAYYGGGMSTTFPDTSDLSFAHAGYFEFNTDTVASGSTITGGCFYDITTDGSLGNSNKLIDALSDDNEIGTTAYGLISPTRLTGTQIPVEANSTPCVCTNAMNTDNAPNQTYYFYEYDSSVHNSQAGAWTPWSTTAPAAAFKNLAFYIDPNFAASIIYGSIDTFNDTYQIRTAQQLQHIGAALNADDNNRYLSGTFYQTHGITIDGVWDPIGQGTSCSDPFTGKFYGGYRLSTGHTDLKAPTADDRDLFTVTLDSGFAFNMLREESYARTTPSVSIGSMTFSYVYGYGIFGFASKATISLMHIVTTGTIDTQTSNFTTPQTWGSTSSEGIMLGVSSNSAIENCTLEVASGSFTVTCPIAKSSSENIAGGLIGCADAGSTITKPSLTVAGNMTVTTAYTSTAYAGGLIGLSATKISDASIDQTGGSLDLNASATYGSAYSGGVVGYAAGTAAVLSSPTVTINDSGEFASQASAASSGDVCSGGMTGRADAAVSSPSITISGQTDISAQRTGWGSAYSGGVVGYAAGTAAVLSSPTVTINDSGEFASQASAASSGGAFFTGGMVGRTDATIASPSLTASGQTTIGSSSAADGSSAYSGGIVGYSADTGSESISTAHLEVDTDEGFTCAADASSSFGGGIAGRMDGTATDPKVAVTKDALMTVSNTISKDYGDRYLGGMFGYVTKNSSLDNTLSKPIMQISGTFACKVTTASSGTKFLGGMVGESDVPLSTPTLTLAATGGMTISTLSTDTSGITKAGGLIGCTRASLTSADMQIKGSLSCAVASQKTYLGGMTGVLASTNMSFSSIEIPDAGNITLKSINGTADAYVGGAIGFSQDSAASDSYIAAEDGTLELDSTSNTAIAGFSGTSGTSSWNGLGTDSSNSTYSRCYVNAPLNTTSSKGVVGFANCGSGLGTFSSCYVIGMVTRSGSAAGSACGFMSGYPQKATACYSTLMLKVTDKTQKMANWTTGTYIAFTDTTSANSSHFSTCYQLKPNNGSYGPISSGSGFYIVSYSYMTSLSQNSTSESMYAALQASGFALPYSASVASKPGDVFKTTDAAKLTNQQNPFPTATKKDSSSEISYIAYGNWPLNPSVEAFKIVYGGANKLITAWLWNTSSVPLNTKTVYSDSAAGNILTAYAYNILDTSLNGYMYTNCCTWRLQYDGDTKLTDSGYHIYHFSFYISNDISIKSASAVYTTNTANINSNSWLTGCGGLFLVYCTSSTPNTGSYIYGPGDYITKGSGGTNTTSWQFVVPSDKKLYAYENSAASDGNPCLMLPSAWTWS